jgi:hypothetical protein
MSLINLRTLVQPLFTGFRGTATFEDYPPNADLADRAHEQGGVVSYVHPFIASQDTFNHYEASDFKREWNFDAGYEALELPVDLALGKVEALDLATRFDTFDLTAMVYQRLLNCGFRLAVGAGTDVYANLKRNPPIGIERMYAFSPNSFSYANYIDGMKAGRTFATNGPMIALSVNGQPIGSTITLDRAGDMMVKASARAQFPIERLQIIVGGEVAETATASGDRLSVAFEAPVRIPRSTWVAVRADGPRHPMLISGNPLAAYSSPVYLHVGDEPIASATDAKFFIAWIEKLWQLVDARGRWSAPSHRQYVRGLFRRAQDVYQGIAAKDHVPVPSTSKRRPQE